MKTGKLSEHIRGWIIGHFEQSLLRTTDFEVAVQTHKKGEYWAPHYHKVATEYNVLISGKMNVCDTDLQAGDTFIIEPNEIAAPIFYEDCTIMCVKVPSVPGDKYIV